MAVTYGDKESVVISAHESSSSCTARGSLRPGRGWRRHQWRRYRRRCRRARPVGVSLRAGRPGRTHLLRQQQAGARRAALSRTLRAAPGSRSAGRARSAAGQGAAHHHPATLRAALPSASAPVVDDPHRPVSLRSPRQARKARWFAQPAFRCRQPAQGRDHPRLRIFRLLGRRCAAGGTQCHGGTRAGRAYPHPHSLRQRAQQQGALASASGASGRQPVFDPRPRAGQRHRTVGSLVHRGAAPAGFASRHAPDPGQPYRRAETL